MLNTHSLKIRHRSLQPFWKARDEIRETGRISAVTAAHLEALGYNVGALERRLIERSE